MPSLPAGDGRSAADRTAEHVAVPEADEPPEPVHEEAEVLVHGPIFDLVSARLQLSSGRRQELLIVEHPGAVAIVAWLEDGRVLLVRQYRHAARRHLIEVPAGRIEPGETPLAAARRELEEETGMRAREWRELTTFLPAPGFCSERITLFEARELEPGLADPDEDEELELLRLLPSEVLQRTPDGKTLLALLWVTARSSAP